MALAILLDSDFESNEVEEDYDDLLNTLALAYHAIYPTHDTSIEALEAQ